MGATIRRLGVATLTVLGLTISGCTSAGHSQAAPSAGKLATPRSQHAFDPPLHFNTAAAVAVPAEAEAGDINVGGKIVGSLAATLYQNLVLVGSADRLQVLDSSTGRVTPFAPPHEPLSLTKTNGFLLNSIAAGAPLVADVDSRPVAVSPFIVTIPGAGTTPSHLAAELVAVDLGTLKISWTMDVDLSAAIQAQNPHRSASLVGAYQGTAVLVVQGEDGVAQTVGVDLASHHVAWQQDTFAASAIADRVVVGTTGTAGNVNIVGESIPDGSRLWSRSAGSAVVVGAGSPMYVVASGIDKNATEAYFELVNVATGAPVSRTSGAANTADTTVSTTVDYQITCFYDGTALSVCDDDNGTWAGAFDSTGKWIWELPDTKANRVAPDVTAVYHGVVYGQTENGPLMLDARTGADKPPSPGVAPFLVNGYLAVAQKPGGEALFAFPADG